MAKMTEEQRQALMLEKMRRALQDQGNVPAAKAPAKPAPAKKTAAGTIHLGKKKSYTPGDRLLAVVRSRDAARTYLMKYLTDKTDDITVSGAALKRAVLGANAKFIDPDNERGFLTGKELVDKLGTDGEFEEKFIDYMNAEVGDGTVGDVLRDKADALGLTPGATVSTSSGSKMRPDSQTGAVGEGGAVATRLSTASDEDRLVGVTPSPDQIAKIRGDRLAAVKPYAQGVAAQKFFAGMPGQSAASMAALLETDELFATTAGLENFLNEVDANLKKLYVTGSGKAEVKEELVIKARQKISDFRADLKNFYNHDDLTDVELGASREQIRQKAQAALGKQAALSAKFVTKNEAVDKVLSQAIAMSLAQSSKSDAVFNDPADMQRLVSQLYADNVNEFQGTVRVSDPDGNVSTKKIDLFHGKSPDEIKQAAVARARGSAPVAEDTPATARVSAATEGAKEVLDEAGNPVTTTAATAGKEAVKDTAEKVQPRRSLSKGLAGILNVFGDKETGVAWRRVVDPSKWQRSKVGHLGSILKTPAGMILASIAASMLAKQTLGRSSAIDLARETSEDPYSRAIGQKANILQQMELAKLGMANPEFGRQMQAMREQALQANSQVPETYGMSPLI